MSTLRKYRKKPDSFVTAVQLRLETDGFEYQKWGGTQRCKRGDWLVDNEGDIYTVDQETFARTYERVRPGVFFKTAEVWAEVAHESGSIDTLEGVTHYSAGDYLVYNRAGREDGYAVEADTFEDMYEPVETGDEDLSGE